ncbi:hypothetical protein BDV11DRAFT_167296 [Aspergillus similis]
MGLRYDIEAIRQRQSARDAARDSTQILVRAGAPSPQPTQVTLTSFPSYRGFGTSAPSTANQPAQPVSAQSQYSYSAHSIPQAQVGLNPPLRFLTDPLPSLGSEASGLADSGDGLVYNACGIVTAHLFFPLIVQVVPNAPVESYLFEAMGEDDLWQAEYGWDDTDGPLPQEGDVAFGWWADRGKLKKGEGRVVKTYRNVRTVWVEDYVGVTL